MLPLPMNKNVRQRLRRVASRQNPLVKDLRRAFARSETTSDGSCAIESVRLVEEAIRSGLKFRAVFFRQSSLAVADRLLPQIAAQVETVLLPNEIFDSAVATETPQGVAALAKVKSFTLEDVLRPYQPLVVVLSGIQDPGNLGTILRSAEAFGAAGIFLTEGTVSPYNSKVLRGSAGSIFRLPFVRIASLELIPLLCSRGVRLLATSSHQGTPLPQIAWTLPFAIFIGNEGAGLSRELSRQMDETLVIPQAAQVESLNAGVAASIVLYEAARKSR